MEWRAPLRFLRLALFACFLFAVLSANAQTSPILSINVGQTSSVQTATLTFTAATVSGSPFTINVLKQGSSGLDLYVASGGTCSPSATYNIGDSCSVNYTFSPLHPGLQQGAVSLTVGTTALATTYISGTGEGPQLNYLLPQQLTLAGYINGGPNGIAVDGAGDVFISELFGPVFGLSGGEIAEIPKGCMNTGEACVVPYITQATMAGINNPSGEGAFPESIAIDGAGNLYIGFEYPPNPSLDTGLYEFPHGCTSASCAIPIGSGMYSVYAVAVDGLGNVYAESRSAGNISDDHVSRLSPGCSSASCMTTITGTYPGITSLAVDQHGNVFFTVPDAAFEIPAGCSDSSCTLPLGSFTAVSVTVDGLGNLFYSDYHDLYEIPVGCTDASCHLTLQTGYQNLAGPTLATDGAGNVYAMDDQADAGFLYELDLTDPPTVTFPTTAQGNISPQQTITLRNGGNQPFAFSPATNGPNPVISQYFTLDTISASTCGAFITATPMPTLQTGDTCTLPIAFAPTSPALGTTDGTLTLADDNLNVNNATQVISLTGDAALAGQTSATLTSSLNASSLGQSVTFTANITSYSGTPTGSITFTDGSTTIATVALNRTGTATTVDTALTVGTHTITATYVPTGSFLASNATLAQQVNADVAVDVLTASPNPALVGSAVALTATVSASPVGSTPTGTITFTSGSSNLATVPLVNGVATYSTSSLPVGSNTLGCVYSGDTNYASTNCQSVFESVDSSTTPATLTLASSANPAGPYTAFNFTAKLTHNRTQPIANDQVTLTIDGAPVSQNTTNVQGTVAFPLQSGLAPGQHTVVATSSVEGVYTSATASLTETVNQAPSTSTLTVTPTTTSAGSAVNLSAAIGGSLSDTVDGLTLTPTGTVTFSSNGTALSTVTVTNSTATYATAALPVGADSITCTYSGDTNFAASTCNSVPVTLSLISSSLTVTASADPSPALSAVTFSATLLGGGTPVGGASIVFAVDGANVATVKTNVQGVATYTAPSLSVGQHAVIATFAGSGNYAGKQSTPLTEQIQVNPTTTTLSASPNPVQQGQPLSVSIAVSATQGTSAPTGSVALVQGSTTLATAMLTPPTSGVISTATLSISSSALPVGADNITCTYSGDTNFVASACNSLPLTVSLTPSTLTVTPSANPSPALSAVTFSAILLGGSTPMGNAPVVFAVDGTNVATATTNTQGLATYTTSTLSVGPHTITASFAGSGSYTGAQSTSLSQQVQANPTAASLSASPNPVQQGHPLSVSVAVSATQGINAPTGSVALVQGSTTLATATLTTPMSGVIATATVSISSLPAGSDSIQVNYTPADGNFVGSSSTLSTVTVDVPDFSVAADPTSLSIGSGQSGSSTINVTSLGLFAGSVQLSCGSGLPLYMSCSFAQSTVTLSANGRTSSTLTINTTQNSQTALLGSGSRLSKGILLAILLPFAFLRLKRSKDSAGRIRQLTSMTAVAICLGGLLVSMEGCGNGSPDATPAGTYTIPIVVSGTNAGSLTPTSHTLFYTVTVTR